MSTSVLQEFLIKIGVNMNTAQLGAVNAAVAETGASAAILDKEVTAAATSINTKLTPSLKSMLLPLTAITAAIGFAYKEMFDFVETSAEGFEQISHLANRVNTSAEAIKKLGYIAQFSRSSIEAAQSSLDGLNKAAGSTALGIGRAKVVFKDIGVNVKDANGKLKDTTALMFEVGQKIKGMERGKQLAVLSRLGIDPTMVETLTTDVSGLGAEFDKLYKSAGLDVNKAAEGSIRFAESLKHVKTIFSAVKEAVAASFFDQFAEGFDSLSKVMMQNLPQIINLMKPLITNMIKIAGIALKIGLVFAGVASNMLNLVGKINDATGGWALKIGAILFAWKKLNLAFLASPIGIIIELATAFSLLYDDYKVWERGGNSFIDWGNKSGKIIKIATEIIGGLAAGFIILKGVLYGARTAALAFNLAMDLNPVVLAIGAVTAAVVLLIDKIKEAQSLLKELSGANAGGGDRTDVMKSHAGLLSFVPGGLLAARLYNPGGGAASNAVTVNNNTAITVQGSGNPYETATAVKNQQQAVNANHVRNSQGAVR